MKSSAEITEINNTLINAFHEILGLGKSALGGDAFDETIYKILHSHLKKYKFDDVSDSHWKKYYGDYKSATSKQNFDFKNLSPTNELQDDCLLVDKPNGSQNWPDILPIFNKVGLPLEVKSAKDDGIIWNSGLPQDNRIYIFGCYKKGSVTAFLGQDVLSDHERKRLKIMAQASKDLGDLDNKILKESKSSWNFYSRSMFISNEKYFVNEEIKKAREDKVFDLLKNLTWEV